MSVTMRLILSLWVVGAALLAVGSFGLTDFYGMPFWVRWLCDAFATAGVLFSMWERRS